MARKNDFSDFNQLAQIALAYRSSKALLVALHFDLFTWLNKGYTAPEDLSRKLHLDLRALKILLNAISSLGFLTKQGGKFRNTPLARKLLVAGSPHYKGNNLKFQERTWDAWSDLRHVLKTGNPRKSLLEWVGKDAFTQDYIKAMHDIAKEPAKELAQKLDWRGVERTLDVGCGPGTYSAAFVNRHPETKAVLFDLPRTLKVTKAVLESNPRRKQFTLRPGNYLNDSFGHREFDLIIISHTTHNETPRTNKTLVRKAFKALRPGGRLVIHDFILNQNRNSPRFSALFSLHLLVFTGSGETYTLGEYSDWMRKARFGKIRRIRLANGSINPSFAITGQKA